MSYCLVFIVCQYSIWMCMYKCIYYVIGTGMSFSNLWYVHTQLCTYVVYCLERIYFVNNTLGMYLYTLWRVQQKNLNVGICMVL